MDRNRGEREMEKDVKSGREGSFRRSQPRPRSTRRIEATEVGCRKMREGEEGMGRGGEE